MVIQKQAQINDPTNPKQIPQTMQSLTQPQQTEKPTTTTPKPQAPPQPKIMPEETRIIVDGLEAIEGIIYAMRQQIWQQYEPIDYQTQKRQNTNPTSIELNFPEEMANKLTFELKNNLWIIKPKAFLGPDTFAKIAAIVRTIGGQYIPQNKQQNIEGHFEVPDRKA